MADLMESDGGARPHAAVLAILKGLVLGLLAVSAIVVWAVNVEHVVAGNSDGLALAWLRMMLCDAIPLATLVALFRSVGQNQPLGRTIIALFATIFWYRGGLFARAGGPATPSER